MAAIEQIANNEAGSSVRTKLNLAITEANKVDGKAASDHTHSNLPTADEKAALEGTGTPSASNKYSTADHNHSGVYVGSSLSSTITLTSGGWSSSSQSVTVSGVTASSTNIIVIESATMGDRWAAAKIYATSQTTDSITFGCQTTPTENIEFKVVILK